MNTTSQDTARAAVGMRVTSLLVAEMVVMLTLPQPPRCARIGSVCVPGHYYSSSSCATCPSGKFSAMYASTVCTPCPPGWNTQGLAGQSGCWPVEATCEQRGPCPRGRCGLHCLPCGCPIDSYADTCTGCVRCGPAAFTDDLGDCRACEDGSIFAYNAGCRRCPNGTYSLGMACVGSCPANFYRDTPASCAACPHNATTDAGGVCTTACTAGRR